MAESSFKTRGQRELSLILRSMERTKDRILKDAKRLEDTIEIVKDAVTKPDKNTIKDLEEVTNDPYIYDNFKLLVNAYKWYYTRPCEGNSIPFKTRIDPYIQRYPGMWVCVRVRPSHGTTTSLNGYFEMTHDGYILVPGVVAHSHIPGDLDVVYRNPFNNKVYREKDIRRYGAAIVGFRENYFFKVFKGVVGLLRTYILRFREHLKYKPGSKEYLLASERFSKRQKSIE